MTKHRWLCDECENIFNESDLLRGVNPFNAEMTVTGCPNCKSVECFTEICDEPECNQPASCGFPTPDGYRRTCFKHSEFNKVKNVT